MSLNTIKIGKNTFRTIMTVTVRGNVAFSDCPEITLSQFCKNYNLDKDEIKPLMCMPNACSISLDRDTRFNFTAFNGKLMCEITQDYVIIDRGNNTCSSDFRQVDRFNIVYLD